MKRTTIVLFTLLWSLTAVAADREGVELAPGTADFALTDLAVAERVEDRTPQEINTEFKNVPATLFCFSVFRNKEAEKRVTHVWRHGEKEISRVSLTVGTSARWRTWTRQKVIPVWSGDWSCEVVDAEGTRLGIAKFRVTPGE